jgi:hypothetical protein
MSGQYSHVERTWVRFERPIVSLRPKGTLSKEEGKTILL